jgi:2-iminobutanoate/2-iminopropanoate deaminase
LENNIFPAKISGITKFIDDDTLFSISGIACSKEFKMTEIKRITTPFSYSSAVAVGDFVFLGLHRGFGNDFTIQLDSTMSQLRKTLTEFELKLEHLVKINVWLKNIKDVQVYEQLFRNYFEEGKYPARMGSTTEFIDDDCLLMIDGIAYRG